MGSRLGKALPPNNSIKNCQGMKEKKEKSY